MTSNLDYSAQPPYASVKNEVSDGWFTCQFCLLKFRSRDEWKSHTFGHFKTKQCFDCDAHLIQICDDWFELHTNTKCQRNNHNTAPLVKHVEKSDHLVVGLEVKQEPKACETELQHNDDDSDINLDEFGEAFAADFNAVSDYENCDTFSMDADDDSNVQFANSARPQYTFNVTNIREISKQSVNIQTKPNTRSQNSCNHCGRTFCSFKQLNNHIIRCASSRRKREYFRSHPHRPASDFICDLCGKTLRKFRSLLYHMNEIHLRNASYKCQICDKSYPSRYYLQKHVNRHKDLLDGNGGGGDGIVEAINDDLDYGLMERRKYRSRLEIQSPADLTCDECGRQFKHYYLLVEHKSSQHAAESEFQCLKCERYYPNRYYLQKHMKRHASAEAYGIPFDSLAVDIDEGLMERSKYIRLGPNEDRNVPFECDDCGETFTKFGYLTQHRRAKHNFNNGFQCKKCGRNYPSRYYLAKHYKQHEKQENEPELNLNFFDNDVGADDGDDDYSIIMERKQYVRNHPHQPKSGFICETCGITIKRYESLKEHMISKHSSSDSFMCSQCHCMYPSRYYLQKHMKRHQHGQPQEEIDHLDDILMERIRYFRVHPHRPTSNFVCDICHKSLSSYYSVREHMVTRHVNKKQKKLKKNHKHNQNPCPKCGKKFLSQKRLQRHNCTMHQHRHLKASNTPKPRAELKQMCSTCGRLFPDRSRLKEHEETHKGIMSSCEFCGKQFMHKNYLRKHIRSVHCSERPFSCNINGCEWSFAYQQCLKRHQARRHGMVTNRNACPICSKEFPDSSYHLKRHLKAHANNTAKEYIPESKSAAANAFTT